jgi:hypothetical protein
MLAFRKPNVNLILSFVCVCHHTPRGETVNGILAVIGVLIISLTNNQACLLSDNSTYSENEIVEFSILCGVFRNRTQVALLRKLSSEGGSITGHLIELDGVSSFTVMQNLRYLYKYKLIEGSITSKKLSYALNYERLRAFKKMFDEIYKEIDLIEF